MFNRLNHVTAGMIVGCLYLYGLSLILAVAFSEPYDRSKLKECTVYSKPAIGGICGSDIDEALRFICGVGNFGEFGKRSLSVRDRFIRDMRVTDYLALTKQTAPLTDHQESGGYGDVMIPRSDATNFLNKRMPFRMSGVSCECCYHSCSIGELLDYCQDKNKAGVV